MTNQKRTASHGSARPLTAHEKRTLAEAGGTAAEQLEDSVLDLKSADYQLSEMNRKAMTSDTPIMLHSAQAVHQGHGIFHDVAVMNKMVRDGITNHFTGLSENIHHGTMTEKLVAGGELLLDVATLLPATRAAATELRAMRWAGLFSAPASRVVAVSELDSAIVMESVSAEVAVFGAEGGASIESLSSKAAFNGELYPPEKLAQLVTYLERRNISVYGTEGNPAFVARADGTGHMLLPENPTTLQVKHELSHYLDFKKNGFEVYRDRGRAAREVSVLERLQQNRIWNNLNTAEKEFSTDYFNRLLNSGRRFTNE